ncbi:uncharacterized protein METZ01_LOCUS463060, partial [marine metagenome]
MSDTPTAQWSDRKCQSVDCRASSEEFQYSRQDADLREQADVPKHVSSRNCRRPATDPTAAI